MTFFGNRKYLLHGAVALAALLVACGPGGACESDREQADAARLQQFQQTLRSLQTPTPTATPTATATAAAAGTSPASTPSAPSVPAATAYGGKIGLGYDHPPFSGSNGTLGGASAGIVCGALTGVPAGAIVTLNLSGGTGAPASVTGPVGGDGAFSVPFPINSYGPMNAAVGGVKTAAGAALTGSVPAASLAVAGGPDVACTPK